VEQAECEKTLPKGGGGGGDEQHGVPSAFMASGSADVAGVRVR
jgi:hypothetical protein